MPTFAEIANNVNNIDFNQILQRIFKKEKVTEFIINSIQKRLWNHGITGDDEVLITDTAKLQKRDFYSKYTAFKKHEDSMPYDRVTLNQTGEFYASIDVVSKSLYFEILADFKSGKIYENFKTSFTSSQVFEDAILSLTQNSFTILLKNYVQNEIIQEIKKNI